MVDRVQVMVYLTRKTFDRFLGLLPKNVDGRPVYGSISRSVEVALEDYIEKHGTLDAHTQVRMNPGYPPDKAVCVQILYALTKRGIENEFVSRDLVNAVAEVRGSDRRTVKHWRTRLEEYGFISVRIVSLGVPIFKMLYHPPTRKDGC